jgi:hypothetical protein
MNKNFLYGLLALVFSALACEPMIAIGKYEFLILIGLIALLLGPPICGFIHRVEKFLKKQDK